MPELNDADLVRWVINRLVKGLGDSPNCEYMLRLAAIAKKLERKEDYEPLENEEDDTDNSRHE